MLQPCFGLPAPQQASVARPAATHQVSHEKATDACSRLLLSPYLRRRRQPARAGVRSEAQAAAHAGSLGGRLGCMFARWQQGGALQLGVCRLESGSPRHSTHQPKLLKLESESLRAAAQASQKIQNRPS